MNNPMNNVLLQIYESADKFEIEESCRNFAEQPTIEIVNQSATVVINSEGLRWYHVFLWFRWSIAGRA